MTRGASSSLRLDYSMCTVIGGLVYFIRGRLYQLACRESVTDLLHY